MKEDAYVYSSDGSPVTLKPLPWDEIQPRRGLCVIVTNSNLRWRKYTCSGTRYSRFHTICELQAAPGYGGVLKKYFHNPSFKCQYIDST